MGLGEPIRLALVVDVLLELLEVFAGRFLFVRRLAPARVSELAHTSMLRRRRAWARETQSSRELISIDVANIVQDRGRFPFGNVSGEG